MHGELTRCMQGSQAQSHLSAEAVSSAAPSGMKHSALQDSLCGFLLSRSSCPAASPSPCALEEALLAKTCTRPVTRPTATSDSAGWKQQSCGRGDMASEVLILDAQPVLSKVRAQEAAGMLSYRSHWK